MKNHFLTLIILLTGFIQAQELPESLTLKESIAYGLTNNRSIINADREIQKSKKVCFNKLNHKLHLSQKKDKLKNTVIICSVFLTIGLLGFIVG